ncbi:MAG: 4-(cytidine 5'-diphospho)-2-C-methyl-D-erythritol kinase [Planctomycetota bacterium]
MSGTELLSRDCPAKINLFLEVLSRRADGFHEIDTILRTIGLFDTLFARKGPPGIRLRVEGADLPTDGGNLVHRAAAALLDVLGPGPVPERGVDLTLVKRIPVQAGLGGGSSDAAGTLLLLRDLFAPAAADVDLPGLAARLGSDVPFFLTGGTARATGRGEVIETLDPAPESWLVLFRPDFGLSTPDVYGRVEIPAAPREPGDEPFNRLEAAAAALDPRVGEFKERVAAHCAGGESPVLSGSGSVFFVLVDGVDRAGTLAAAFNRAGAGRATAVRTPA